MTKNTSYFFFILTILLLNISCSKSELLTIEEKEWLRENDSISIAIHPYYPPFQFFNKNNEIDGIFIEYLDFVEKKINYKFKKVYYKDWAKLLQDAKDSKIDLVLEIHKTEDRQSYLNFHPPFLESNQVIVTRKDAPANITLDDLANKTIILPKDFAIVELLNKQYPLINIVTTDNEINCLKILNNGQYDAYVGIKAFANYYLQYNKLDNLSINSETPIIYRPGMGSRKNLPILTTIIDKATQLMTEKEKKIIINNWYFSTIEPFYKTTQFWIISALSSIILFLLIISSNYYLKFKIKQKTEELFIAKEIAEESTKLKTSFINNIPQEIRTPMNGIISLSEFLEDDTLPSEDRKKYTQMIIASSKTLISIIDNILEISKLQSNRFTLKLAEVDINLLLKTLYAFYEIKTKEKTLSFTIENKLAKNSNHILTDRPKLNKILHAVIDNSIKFTNQGAITITYKVQEHLLIIEIRDTGIGIAQENLQLIQESLSKNNILLTKDLEGLGLGLIIAKKNADFLGGQIQVTSTKGKGSNFTLQIPYTPIKHSTNLTHSTSEQLPLKKEKHIILIAEDGETNFLFLKTILSKMNAYEFVIYRAVNGKEAVTICEENKNIDLVLMDIKMPIMNGYDATKYIKKMRPDLPIIAQTAYSVEEDVQKALDAGCDDFISKPVDRKILLPMLKKHFSIFHHKK